jgi:hypothetical protein
VATPVTVHLLPSAAVPASCRPLSCRPRFGPRFRPTGSCRPAARPSLSARPSTSSPGSGACGRSTPPRHAPLAPVSSAGDSDAVVPHAAAPSAVRLASVLTEAISPVPQGSVAPGVRCDSAETHVPPGVRKPMNRPLVVRGQPFVASIPSAHRRLRTVKRADQKAGLTPLGAPLVFLHRRASPRHRGDRAERLVKDLVCGQSGDRRYLVTRLLGP